jgi:1,4-dihydroxy-2-naphthoate octaprenyltransferase
MYHTFLVFGALVCHLVFITQQHHPMAFIGLVPFALLLLHVRKVMATKDPKEFDPELKKVALSTFAVAVLTSVGLMIG